VAPTAVLRHFRDKDDLLLALGARLLEDALAQADEDEPDWRERLLSLARATRRSFEAHPRVALLVANRTLRREAEFRAADLTIGAVQQAGLSGREAAAPIGRWPTPCWPGWRSRRRPARSARRSWSGTGWPGAGNTWC
jgi:AcrR family transcriptional regulator